MTCIGLEFFVSWKIVWGQYSSIISVSKWKYQNHYYLFLMCMLLVYLPALEILSSEPEIHRQLRGVLWHSCFLIWVGLARSYPWIDLRGLEKHQWGGRLLFFLGKKFIFEQILRLFDIPCLTRKCRESTNRHRVTMSVPGVTKSSLNCFKCAEQSEVALFICVQGDRCVRCTYRLLKSSQVQQ